MDSRHVVAGLTIAIVLVIAGTIYMVKTQDREFTRKHSTPKASNGAPLTIGQGVEVCVAIKGTCPAAETRPILREVVRALQSGNWGAVDKSRVHWVPSGTLARLVGRKLGVREVEFTDDAPHAQGVRGKRAWLPMEMVTAIQVPRKATSRVPPKVVDLSPLLKLMGKRRKELDKVFGKPKEVGDVYKACRTPLVYLAGNEPYYRCKYRELEYSYGGFLVTAGLEGRRCTYLSLEGPAGLLPNEASAAAALKVGSPPRPFRVSFSHGSSAAWTSYRGNQVLRYGGTLYDLTYRTSNGNAAVDIKDVALPKRPRWLSDRQADKVLGY